MRIVGIRAKEVMTCAGSWMQLAEAEVVTELGSVKYVAIMDCGDREYVVLNESAYDCVIGDAKESGEYPVEDYTEWKDAMRSEYSGVFTLLRSIVGKLG